MWSGADIILRQAMQFLFTIALVRMLSPTDFGTVALLTLFTGIATAVVDGGFSAALIQNQRVDHVDESTVFWCNLVIGVVVAVAYCAIGPLVAIFYAQPVLSSLMSVMAVNVFLGALGTIHRTLLTKQLNFRLQMRVGLVSAVVSGCVAILMALNGYGVWALVAQIVTMTAVSTCLFWVWHPWRPAWVWSASSAQKLFGFGGYHLVSGVLDVVYAKFYTLVIGKLYSARELGYYNNADNTSQLPGAFLVGVLTRVALPMFSFAADDKSKLRRGVQLSVRGVILINAPAMFGMAALADPLVRVLFGAQWLPAVPSLRVLCLACILLPLHVINLNVLMAQGHSKLMLRLEVIKKVLGVVLTCIGALFGVLGVAWSQVIFSVLALFINAHYSKRFLQYGFVEQLLDFSPPLVVAGLMALVVYLVSQTWHASPAEKLVGLVILGGSLYFFATFVFRLKAVRDVAELIVATSSRKLGD